MWLSGKNLPAMKETPETQAWSLGQEYPLDKEMATHSSILAWEIPSMEEPGKLQSMRSQKSRTQLSANNNIVLVKVLFSPYFYPIFAL